MLQSTYIIIKQILIVSYKRSLFFFFFSNFFWAIYEAIGVYQGGTKGGWAKAKKTHGVIIKKMLIT